MKTKFNLSLAVETKSFTGAVFAGTLLLLLATRALAASAPSQNLFVANPGLGNVYKITPGGTQSTFATGLGFIQGMGFDSTGNLFVSDGSGSTIYKVTPGGVKSTFASGLTYAGSVAVNSAGDVFVANDGYNSITEITPGGMQSVFANEGIPQALAFDSAGNLYAPDHNGTIYKYTPGGAQSTFASSPGLSAYEMSFDGAGNLFVADPNAGNIYKFTPGGVQSVFASLPSFVTLHYPEGVAVDTAGNGNVFVSDADTGNIYEYTPSGVQSVFVSGLNAPSLLAFQPVPEPFVLGLLAVGVAAFFVHRRGFTGSVKWRRLK